MPAKRVPALAVANADQRQLKRQLRDALQLSLRNPHPKSRELADLGIEQWAKNLPAEDAAELVDLKAGKPVRWIPDKGWVEIRE